ncbi:MAG: hotdog domain-containing protein [Phycisphaerales bacterium]
MSAPACAFRRDAKVLFKHCDPAELVFFPRFFEMMNDLVEEFFDAIGYPFEDFHQQGAIPTVQVEAGFPRPSRHGDRLQFALWVEKIGRTSSTIRILTESGGETRMTYRATMVLVGGDGRPKGFPDALRQAMMPYMESEDA